MTTGHQEDKPPAATKTFIYADHLSLVANLEQGLLPTLTQNAADRYAPGQLLATGGMGTIHQSIDHQFNRQVAIKYLKGTTQDRQAGTSRFLQEAQLTGQLEHPNIVPVYEIGITPDAELFYTMKLVQGQTLQQLLDQLRDGAPNTLRTYNLRRLITILTSICDAIAYAHSRGIIHRDLKPANVMIGEFGEVLVMDWGLAKVITQPDTKTPPPTTTISPSAHTLHGHALGTPGYMPPEQATGDLDAIDTRSDIYAIGAILYHLILLDPPPPATPRLTPKNIAASAAARHRRPPPESLTKVVEKACHPQPDQRYQSVTAFRAELDAFLNGYATDAMGATFGQQLALLIRRWRREAAIIAAAIVIIATIVTIALTALTHQRNDAVHSRNQAIDSQTRALQAQQEIVALSLQAAPEFVAKYHTHVAHGEWAEAQQAARFATQLAPNLPSGWHCLALAASANHDWDTLRQAIAMIPTLALTPSDQSLTQLTYCFQPLTSLPPTDATIIEIARRMHQRGLHQPAARMLPQSTDSTIFTRLRHTATIDALTTLNPGATIPKTAISMTTSGIHIDLAGIREITDISPLASLPITSITLKHTSVSDITPLTGQPIQIANLQHTQITDLTPIANTALRHLAVDDTPLTSLTPLTDRPLAWLTVARTRISDLTPLARMPLIHLDISGCRAIADLSPLHHMPLKTFYLAETKVDSLTPIADAPLTDLDLRNTRVITLAPVAQAPITRLLTTGAPIADIRQVATMPLRELHTSLPATTSATVLAELSDLTVLSLHSASEEALLTLTQLPLERLNLLACRTHSLAPLARLKTLTNLTITATSVADLTPLTHLPLEHLYIIDCPVSDLTPLNGKPIKTLRMEGTRITDTTPLASLTQLYHLDLSRTPITTVEPLAKLKLTTLYLQGCRQLKTLYPLATITTLEHLIIPDHIQAQGPLRSLNLRSIGYTKGYPQAPKDFWQTR